MVIAISSLLSLLFGVLLAGWFASSRKKGITEATSNSEGFESSGDVPDASQVLAKLLDLTNCVATDLDDHQCQLDGINNGLTTLKNPQTRDVVKAVSNLVEVNQAMRSRLETAEGKLRDQAAEIETRATEARTDALMLIANRRAFDEEIGRRFAECRRRGDTFSVILIDIDQFKNLNDTHGHLAGDAVLRGLGRVLRREAREMDFPARFGGEEFMILLPGAATQEAIPAAIRLRKAISKTQILHDSQELKVTASFGVAQLANGVDQALLLERVDQALYASKSGGRDCIHWHDGTRCQLIQENCEEEEQQNKGNERQEPRARSVRAKQLIASKTETDGDHCTLVPKTKDVSATKPQAVNELSEFAPNSVDRTTFCSDVRRRLAEWKRGGPRFSIVLIELSKVVFSGAERKAGEAIRAGQDDADFAFRETSELLVSAVRQMDLVGKFNSRAFALLFPTAQLRDVVRVADRLRQAVANHLEMLGCDGDRLVVSVGAVEVSEFDDAIEILRRLECTLNAARESGGNTTFKHDGESFGPAVLRPDDALRT